MYINIKLQANRNIESHIEKTWFFLFYMISNSLLEYIIDTIIQFRKRCGTVRFCSECLNSLL